MFVTRTYNLILTVIVNQVFSHQTHIYCKSKRDPLIRKLRHTFEGPKKIPILKNTPSLLQKFLLSMDKTKAGVVKEYVEYCKASKDPLVYISADANVKMTPVALQMKVERALLQTTKVLGKVFLSIKLIMTKISKTTYDSEGFQMIGVRNGKINMIDTKMKTLIVKKDEDNKSSENNINENENINNSENNEKEMEEEEGNEIEYSEKHFEEHSSKLNANAPEYVPKVSIHSASINADTIKKKSPPKKKISYIEKCHSIFIFKSQEARNRFKNLTISDQLIRELEKDFKSLLNIDRKHPFVAIYIDKMLKPLLHLQELLQIYEEVRIQQVGSLNNIYEHAYVY